MLIDYQMGMGMGVLRAEDIPFSITRTLYPSKKVVVKAFPDIAILVYFWMNDFASETDCHL